MRKVGKTTTGSIIVEMTEQEYEDLAQLQAVSAETSTDHARHLLEKLREKATGEDHFVNVEAMLSVIEFENGCIRHDKDREAFKKLVDDGLIVEYNAGLGITGKGMRFE